MGPTQSYKCTVFDRFSTVALRSVRLLFNPVGLQRKIDKMEKENNKRTTAFTYCMKDTGEDTQKIQ